MSALFRWLVVASAMCQLSGAVLILWGLKVVPVSNPFTPFVEDSSQGGGTRPGPGKHEHPWAVTSGAVLFIVGLALAVAAGIAKP